MVAAGNHCKLHFVSPQLPAWRSHLAGVGEERDTGFSSSIRVGIGIEKALGQKDQYSAPSQENNCGRYSPMVLTGASVESLFFRGCL